MDFWKWFYGCMSARKVDISPKIEIHESFSGLSGMGVGQETSVMVSAEPTTKNGFKGLIEQIFQFVTVGGDFA